MWPNQPRTAVQINADQVLRKQIKCRSDHFLRFFAELRVEVRMIVRIHPTLKCLRGRGSIKEPRRYAQRTDPITGSRGRANLLSLANACHGLDECANCR